MDRQVGMYVIGCVDGWNYILTAIYTGKTSLYLYIFVGLKMKQDESIFVPFFRKKDIVFITNIIQLKVLSSYYW